MVALGDLLREGADGVSRDVSRAALLTSTAVRHGGQERWRRHDGVVETRSAAKSRPKWQEMRR